MEIRIGSMSEIEQSEKRNKGMSLLELPDDYVVLDLETTGFYPWSDIIEIALVKVKDNQIAYTVESLIKPPDEIPEIITKLTGITNESVIDAPSIQEIIPNILSELSGEIIVAHNANFDINFLYDVIFQYDGTEFNNNFVDTLRLSRKIFQKFPKHSLKYLAENIPLTNKNGHRALTDCLATFDLFNIIKTKIITEGITLKSASKRKLFKPTDIKPFDDSLFDTDSPFFGEECVFTGTLESMVRREAMEHVISIGGCVKETVTKKTKFLIMGLQDYSRFTDGIESSKTIKAKKYASEGQNIHTISEEDFLKIINNIE